MTRTNPVHSQSVVLCTGCLLVSTEHNSIVVFIYAWTHDWRTCSLKFDFGSRQSNLFRNHLKHTLSDQGQFLQKSL